MFSTVMTNKNTKTRDKIKDLLKSFYYYLLFSKEDYKLSNIKEYSDKIVESNILVL